VQDMKDTTMPLPVVVLAVAVVTFGLTSYARAQSSIDPVDKWAWGTNVGWVNFAPVDGVVTVFPDHLEGFAWGENIGWIRLGTHIGGGPHTYGNTSPSDYGVNHDGAGNLLGYAWGTNVGWVNFAPIHGGVTADLVTGELNGHAWAENVGWISFRGTGGVAYGVRIEPIEIFLYDFESGGVLFWSFAVP
jgi:hypothetical protein